MIDRAWFLLVNLADNDNVGVTAGEVDFVALPCKTFDELAAQVALGRLGLYIRAGRVSRPRGPS